MTGLISAVLAFMFAVITVRKLNIKRIWVILFTVLWFVGIYFIMTLLGVLAKVFFGILAIWVIVEVVKHASKKGGTGEKKNT